jgi:carbamoyl-phosphate synthase large subunit
VSNVPVKVLVTGLGGGAVGEQILKALRLAHTPYDIVGADVTLISKGLTSVEKRYLLPPASEPSYMDELLEICEKEGIRAVFSGSEMELKVVSDQRDRILERDIFLPINPKSVIDICLNKSLSAEFISTNGFFSPISIRVTHPDDIRRVDFLPAVVKPSVGGGGSANIFLAQTMDEVEFFGKYLLRMYSEFIIQEYVGTPETEFTVGVLSDMDGELINSIAIKRHILSSLSNRIKCSNRTGRSELGNTLAISSGISQGEIGPFREVTAECERLAKAIGSAGALNIQCRVHEGRVYVFEINPRFSGTTSMRAMVGYNEPDILVRKHLLGESVSPGFGYGSGFVLRGLEETFLPQHA